MGKHPLATRRPKEDLGRWAPKTPTAPPHRQPNLPPPGQHIWVLLSWHIITAGQAAAVANSGAVTVEPSRLIARQVGCYTCRVQYADGVGKPCSAPQLDPETPPEEPPIEPEPPPQEVPVDPPTPPDAGPPVVELARPMGETALS